MGEYLSAALSVVNSGALRHCLSGGLSNRPVKTVEEIRVERLRELRDEYGTPPFVAQVQQIRKALGKPD